MTPATHAASQKGPWLVIHSPSRDGGPVTTIQLTKNIEAAKILGCTVVSLPLALAAEGLLERCRELSGELLGLVGAVSDPDNPGAWSDLDAYDAYQRAVAQIAAAEGTAPS